MTILEEASVEELPKRKQSKLFAIFLAFFCYYLGASHFYLRQYFAGSLVLISFLAAVVVWVPIWFIVLMISGWVHIFVIFKDKTFKNRRMTTTEKINMVIIMAILLKTFAKFI